MERRLADNRALIRVGLVLALVVLTPGLLFADGFRHQPDEGVLCLDCHHIHDGPLIPTGLELLIACQACHNPLGWASEKSDVALHDIGDGEIDCGKCHDPHFPTEPNADNMRFEVLYETVHTLVDYPDVDPRRFVAGGEPYDGICEVCHTETSYHRNNSDGDHSHNVETACTTCHPHIEGFRASGGDCDACHGQPPDGLEFPNTAGSHATHMGGVYGPDITDCFLCHAALGDGHMNGLASFASGTDENLNGNVDLDETDVCDPCHSPDGAFDGVGEAKDNWTEALRVSCDGCHDLGSSTIQGVDAPPVIGDNETWGYYATGHGSGPVVPCIECHDTGSAHIDGNPRTYEVGPDGVVNPYNESYRLLIGLDIPRPSTEVEEPEPWRYELCFTCHDPIDVLGDPLLGQEDEFFRAGYATDFRHDPTGYGSWGHGGHGDVLTATETILTMSWFQEDTGRGSPGSMRAFVLPDDTRPFIYRLARDFDWETQTFEVVDGSTMITDNPALVDGGQRTYAFGLPNNHYFHLSNIGSWWDWDSDWDGEWQENGYESTRSCPTCHNVHGSTYPAMIRDGQLIDKAGLQFGVDPDVPDEGSFVIPYDSGTCEGLCHTGWNGGFEPREVYWYRTPLGSASSAEDTLDEPTPPSPIPTAALPTLGPNNPNPFQSSTVIQYELPKQAMVSLEVYDVSGRLVRILASSIIRDAGHHEVMWNGENEQGRRVASGIYICRLRAGEQTVTRSLQLME